jgi:hypothetical protein
MGTSPTLGIAVNDGLHNPARVHAFLALGTRFQTFRVSGDFVWKRTALVILCFLMCGCSGWQATPDPSIEFSRVPPAEDGGPDKLDIIEGRVIGARPGQRIVLYVRNGTWWVQPLVNQPFTTIQPDSKWTNSTHLGTEYAALLVEPGYRPPATMGVLPTHLVGVAAVAIVKGAEQGSAVSRIIAFSGYEWRIRSAPSDRGGVMNPYDAANAWTDGNGLLHLRITKQSDKWVCAEVSLTRTLGYGTYSFRVRDISGLEPAVVLGMFTWDYAGEDQNHREMAIEITRWGDPGNKNAQYVVQPFYIPANVARFAVPSGVLTHSFRWEPGRVSFRTVRGSEGGARVPALSEHVFSSGVPSPGIAAVRMNLYVFNKAQDPLQNEAEVVIEKFEYLP